MGQATHGTSHRNIATIPIAFKTMLGMRVRWSMGVMSSPVFSVEDRRVTQRARCWSLLATIQPNWLSYFSFLYGIEKAVAISTTMSRTATYCQAPIEWASWCYRKSRPTMIRHMVRRTCLRSMSTLRLSGARMAQHRPPQPQTPRSPPAGLPPAAPGESLWPDRNAAPHRCLPALRASAAYVRCRCPANEKLGVQ